MSDKEKIKESVENGSSAFLEIELNHCRIDFSSFNDGDFYIHILEVTDDGNWMQVDEICLSELEMKKILGFLRHRNPFGIRKKALKLFDVVREKIQTAF